VLLCLAQAATKPPPPLTREACIALSALVERLPAPRCKVAARCLRAPAVAPMRD
jgi:hypothetical protein